MTPKQKAQQLIDKFESVSGLTRFSKIYANLCIDEIVKSVAFNDHTKKLEFEDTLGYPDEYFYTYWKEVKKEIDKL